MSNKKSNQEVDFYTLNDKSKFVSPIIKSYHKSDVKDKQIHVLMPAQEVVLGGIAYRSLDGMYKYKGHLDPLMNPALKPVYEQEVTDLTDLLLNSMEQNLTEEQKSLAAQLISQRNRAIGNMDFEEKHSAKYASLKLDARVK